jgi:hypothetical protein
MAPVRRIVLDVLKPHDPELLEFSQSVAGVEGVEAVDVSLIELDKQVQNVKLVAEGEDVDYEALRTAVEDLGATIHSIDEVACGEYLVDEAATASLVRPTWLR